MAGRQLRIAVAGAGMGGLTAAGALLKAGVDVQVFEQAERFLRVGAGIQMSANAMKVLRGLGLEPRLRTTAFQHRARRHRDHDTGKLQSEFDMLAVERKFGAPHLMMHRADLHSALASIVPDERIHLGKKVAGFSQNPKTIELRFTDGASIEADALIAADGVHSVIRSQLFAESKPTYTGRVAYRSVFPAARLNGLDIGDVATKWWGPDRHIVIYYITAQRDEVYFTTSIPSAEPARESWSQKGDIEELRAHFANFHPEVRQVLAACPETHMWPIFDREPMARWGEGRVYLLGDACHPMTPYMAQGAASAIEDAAILARSIGTASADTLVKGLAVYEATRKPRASRIQTVSHMNRRDWMRVDVADVSAGPKEKAEPDWVYGYDAWSAPMQSPENQAA